MKTNRILQFCLLFTSIYCLLFLLFKESAIHQQSYRIFRNYSNVISNLILAKTEIYFQEMGIKNESILVEKTNITLAGIPKLKNFDTKVNLINKSSINRAIALKQMNFTIDLTNHNFSIWHFFLLPFILFLSFVITEILMTKKPSKSIIVSTILFVLLNIFNLIITIYYYNSHSILMESMNLNPLFQNFIDIAFQIQTIEFTYISVLLVYFLSSNKILRYLLDE